MGDFNLKKTYKAPETECIWFLTEDIINSSNVGPGQDASSVDDSWFDEW